jgi:hypothetical protein
LRRWEAIALVAIAVLLTVAAVADVGRRVHAERRLAADKVSYMSWHRARSQRPGWGIKIRYGHPYDVACGKVSKAGNRLKCLQLRHQRSRTHPVVVAGGYRLERPAKGTPFVRSHCFGAARRLTDCRRATPHKL